MARRYNTATARVSDHERFMNAIAFGDVEGVARLVRVALNNHKGPREVVHRLELAIEGKYHVKSFEVYISPIRGARSDLITYRPSTMKSNAWSCP